MVTFESFVTDSLKKYLAAEKPKGNGTPEDAGKKTAIEGESQMKAFQNLEEKLKKEGLNQIAISEKLRELTTSDNYKKLPKY
jgi:hypothetical protein